MSKWFGAIAIRRAGGENINLVFFLFVFAVAIIRWKWTTIHHCFFFLPKEYHSDTHAHSAHMTLSHTQIRCSFRPTWKVCYFFIIRKQTPTPQLHHWHGNTLNSKQSYQLIVISTFWCRIYIPLNGTVRSRSFHIYIYILHLVHHIWMRSEVAIYYVTE